MTLASAIDKTEIKVTLDKEYIITPITVSEFYSTAEAKIKQKRIEEANMIASTLNKEDKMDFLQTVWKSLPKGDELEDLISKFVQTIEGIQILFLIALKKVDPSMTLDFLVKYINLDTLANYLLAFYELIGLKPKDDEVVDNQKKEIIQN